MRVILGLWLAVLVAQAAPAQGEAREERFVLPSGLDAYLLESMPENAGDGLVYRFRFVAPDFTGQEAFETQSTDLEYLCATHAVSQVQNLSPAPRKIVISLADQPSEFGVFDPDVAQIFESFSLKEGACIWEMF